MGILCLAGPAAAQDSPENYHIELGAMYWKPSPQVVISSGTGGTPIDLVSQFSIEDKRFREFRVVLKAAPRHKLRYSTVPIKYSGSATLDQSIIFQGQTFNAGVPATTELEWTLMRFGYELDSIATSMGFAGVFIDVKYNKMNAQLSADPPVGTQTFERNVTVPTLGGIGRAYLSQFISVTGEFTALKLKRGSLGVKNAKVYDFDVYGTANFGRYIGAQLGYRSVTVDYVVDDDTGNLKMKGLYFGGVLRF